MMDECQFTDVSKIRANRAENTISVLQGLISYHERMTMGMYPARDFYLEALKYAVECVREKEAAQRVTI